MKLTRRDVHLPVVWLRSSLSVVSSVFHRCPITTQELLKTGGVGHELGEAW